jgi:hypothetical protein
MKQLKYIVRQIKPLRGHRGVEVVDFNAVDLAHAKAIVASHTGAVPRSYPQFLNTTGSGGSVYAIIVLE